jgi:hypothetical protein
MPFLAPNEVLLPAFVGIAYDEVAYRIVRAKNPPEEPCEFHLLNSLLLILLDSHSGRSVPASHRAAENLLRENAVTCQLWSRQKESA